MHQRLPKLVHKLLCAWYKSQKERGDKRKKGGTRETQMKEEKNKRKKRRERDKTREFFFFFLSLHYFIWANILGFHTVLFYFLSSHCNYFPLQLVLESYNFCNFVCFERPVSVTIAPLNSNEQIRSPYFTVSFNINDT